MSKPSNERGSELLSLLKSSFGRRKGRLSVQHSSVRRTALTSERSSLPRFLALTAAGLLLAALPIDAAPLPHVAAADAVINNTGSTNTIGYTIYISPMGSIRLAHTGQVFKIPTHFDVASVPKAQAKKLFSDLDAAMPLTSPPVHHGMRSASFGTQTYITYKGQKSPDLTFASDPRTVALKADIDAITKKLHIGNVPKRPIVVPADKPIVIHADR